MFAQETIPENGRLSGPIIATVTDVSQPTDEKVDYELAVRDDQGAELPLTVWTIHKVQIDWMTGTKYALDGVRGKCWTSNGSSQCKLSSTADFTAAPVDKSDSDRLLLVGDTHVGYRHRSTTDKPRWAKTVDNRTTFRSVFEKAETLDADAVVHAGDLFDHTTDSSDYAAVEDAVTKWTRNSNRSFSFVFGNHDTAPERRWLHNLVDTNSAVTHIPSINDGYGTSCVDVVGVDYQGSSSGGLHDRLGNAQYTILVVHDTPYPVVDEHSSLRYEEKGLDLRKAVSQLNGRVDLVVTGHMHVAEQGRIEGTEVPVIITGPTAPISSYERENDPSVWLLEASASGIEVERIQLDS